MNKVTTINLNGIAYQVEENGYEALAAYLAQAKAKLEGNPDREEIMRDFEQAVAEKFQTYLSASKNVVATEEVQEVIETMGPVEDEGTAAGDAEKTGATSQPRRFVRIHEGSFLMGVCTGLAVYFGIDVMIVRALFILLAIITSGGAFLGYFLIAAFSPQAKTIAGAESGKGRPFNASEFIREAQQNYQFSHDKHTRHEWKEWKRSMKYGIPPQNPGQPSGGYYLFPFINLLRFVVLLAFISALVSLVTHHAVFGLLVPFGMPVWVALLVLFAVWQFVSFPIRWMKYQTHAAYIGTSIPVHAGRDAFWHTLASILWIVFLALCVWLGYLYIPYVHTLLDTIGARIQMQ